MQFHQVSTVQSMQFICDMYLPSHTIYEMFYRKAFDVFFIRNWDKHGEKACALLFYGLNYYLDNNQHKL